MEWQFDFCIFFQCCLTWLLAYPALAIVSLVLPVHSRFKVSNMEQLKENPYIYPTITKYSERDSKNMFIVMEV